MVNVPEFLVRSTATVTAAETAPDFLVGSAATAGAFLILTMLMMGSLMLALVEMKTERLGAKVREWRNVWASTVAEAEMDIESQSPLAASSKAAKRRARGKGRRSKIQRLMQFFIAAADDGLDEEDGDESVFQLGDESWLAPPGCRQGPPTVAAEAEHFQIGDEESPHPSAARTGSDAFGLPDDLWRAPSAFIDSRTQTGA
jgi:hypothetical protein